MVVGNLVNGHFADKDLKLAQLAAGLDLDDPALNALERVQILLEVLNQMVDGNPPPDLDLVFDQAKQV